MGGLQKKPGHLAVPGSSFFFFGFFPTAYVGRLSSDELNTANPEIKRLWDVFQRRGGPEIIGLWTVSTSNPTPGIPAYVGPISVSKPLLSQYNAMPALARYGWHWLLCFTPA
jgi:hypothetical protein